MHFHRFSQYLRRFLANAILKMKLKKIASAAEEIRYVFIGRLRPLKITCLPPLRHWLPPTDENFIFASDIHITIDEINFLNSTKSATRRIYKTDINMLVTTVASCSTDDISYLKLTKSTTRRIYKADVDKLVTTAASCLTDDISYLNSTAHARPMRSVGRRNITNSLAYIQLTKVIVITKF
jgi:hypothetical protein